MWGNRLGWGLATAWLIVLVGLASMLHKLGGVSLPTAFSSDPDTLRKIDLPMPPTTVAPMMTDATSDAGPLYREAIAGYQSASGKFADFVERPDVDRIEDLPGLKPFLDATPMTSMSFLAADPEKGVLISGENGDLDALRNMATAASQAGVALGSQKRFPDAAKYHAAVFSLGVKLFNERVTDDELQAGIELIARGARGILSVAKAANDTEQLESVNAFLASEREYVEKRLNPIRQRVKTLDSDVLARHAGDYFKLATNAPERLWRVQSVFALGQLRYNAARAGDQKGAMRALRKLADTESDPVVKQAAVVARDMTSTQYHQLR